MLLEKLKKKNMIDEPLAIHRKKGKPTKLNKKLKGIYHNRYHRNSKDHLIIFMLQVGRS